ncbi:ABC transporter ATP-binding protein [Clostridium estertheticum]|uniref:ABC transporter ATP-binding protein n=1 Tax=Clostridium estertheticum TaxID=238834 RepID=UPI001C0B8C32|nr:ABC transporter ATP-binding protein [Clostridium estertheticum]MBU3177982.1 ABC transporter ATP-binding protein [Clostridium estertheticum]
MNTENVIKIENYKQQFGKFVVLENINLDVKKGEILGLLGPSGSGKTTLIKAIVGMSEPTNGSVCVLGTKMPSLAVVSKIGYMAQSDALYEDLTALDNILFFASLYGLKGKFAKQRASEVLELVLLRGEGKKLIKNFSGGMKRRLSLAIALVHKPEILILDEPTVGIDPVLRLQFWKEFERLRKEGVTIIITTHVMDEAEHCDRLALIRSGGLIAIGTPDELKEKSGESTVEGAFLYYGKEGKVNHI